MFEANRNSEGIEESLNFFPFYFIIHALICLISSKIFTIFRYEYIVINENCV